MICDRVGECAEKTRHISPPEKSKKNRGKKGQNKRQKKEDIYQYPLGKSPCGSDACQKIKDSDNPGSGGGTAILVELKGVETRHALKQLFATLNLQELKPLWDSHRSNGLFRMTILT